MTRKQALELEQRCEKVLQDKLGCEVTLSCSVRGDLVIRTSINWISIGLPSYAVSWVRFDGFYRDLVNFIDNVREVVRDNANDFVELLWIYRKEHRLKEDEEE
jgi:hypothetical protein